MYVGENGADVHEDWILGQFLCGGWLCDRMKEVLVHVSEACGVHADSFGWIDELGIPCVKVLV